MNGKIFTLYCFYRMRYYFRNIKLYCRSQTGKIRLTQTNEAHELDIEKEREKFSMEKEKMEVEHKHQLELKQKEMENQVGADLFATMAKEYMRSPAGQAQIRNTGKKR